MEKVWLTIEEKLINWADRETDIYDKWEVVKDKMGFPQVTDRVLEEWAQILVSSVFESEDVSGTAGYLLEEILRQERNFYYRSNGGDEEEESYPMFCKWLHLREKVGRGLKIVLQSISLSVDTYIYLEELYGDEEDTSTESPQVSQAKADFHLKYDGYIKDIDSFFVLLKTIEPKELKHIFTKCFAKSDVTLKAFFNDCRTIVPERDGERGWNYEAVKKY
ncbi:hypothetical protein KSW79_09410 [Prevotella copri]|uniref:hypothetical protein n=1 Tax=Segatella copri TaxID=165179 RepID=UPI001C38784F|nr:hypothetical protein [Segatella copri]MBV3414607.1 hypothetical protein [Segatella copri]